MPGAPVLRAVPTRAEIHLTPIRDKRRVHVHQGLRAVGTAVAAGSQLAERLARGATARARPRGVRGGHANRSSDCGGARLRSPSCHRAGFHARHGLQCIDRGRDRHARGCRIQRADRVRHRRQLQRQPADPLPARTASSNARADCTNRQGDCPATMRLVCHDTDSIRTGGGGKPAFANSASSAVRAGDERRRDPRERGRVAPADPRAPEQRMARPAHDDHVVAIQRRDVGFALSADASSRHTSRSARGAAPARASGRACPRAR